jgi:RimJ/RimL family protein N-acetyltransferase
MRPVILQTVRLVLDQPTLADVDLVTEYCQDPIFEKFMLTPWPYQRSDAEKFIGTVIPMLWDDDLEYTWALRHDGEFLGLVGFRTRANDVGYWLGAPHRGHGFMPEALGAVADFAFERSPRALHWECIPGNLASAGVARTSGFTFLGEGASLYPDRRGAKAVAWRGSLSPTDSREPKPGWPVSTPGV